MNHLYRLLLVLVALNAVADGQELTDSPDPLKSWNFHPQYTLSGTAQNQADGAPTLPANPQLFMKQTPTPFSLLGNRPSEHFWQLLKGTQIPQGAFSIEMWMNYHVNQPVGVAVNQVTGNGLDWSMGYFDNRIFLTTSATAEEDKAIKLHFQDKKHQRISDVGYKQNWHHIVGSFDGKTLTLFHNGTVAGRIATPTLASPQTQSRIEVSAYLENEDYMQLGNTLNTAALYDEALIQTQVAHIFEERKRSLDEGKLYANSFHFTAGPYLNAVGADGVGILWETDRPAQAVLEWGETAHYDRSHRFSELQRTHKFQLDTLKSNTPYFYRITVEDASGHKIQSGDLTFRTAPVAGEPVNFVVVGDTEARPHVNDRLAKQIWGERPNFVVLVGDLTDGGQADHRWQWTHEYFTSMRQLTERVPVLAAPGNGESDLVWYNHYHNLPGDQSYYSHRVGDVEFFMLDSNMGHHDRHRPGFREQQKRWLKNALSRSTAKWKVAAHHHPTYSSDENDYGDSYVGKSDNGDSQVRDDFLSLYERYGVDVVFFGHLHSYERTWPILKGRVDNDGVVYIQTGGGGGNHEESGPTRNWFSNRLYSGYHYTNVNVFGDVMNISTVDTEGRLRDRFSINK